VSSEGVRAGLKTLETEPFVWDFFRGMVYPLLKIEFASVPAYLSLGMINPALNGIPARNLRVTGIVTSQR
jgi:hypothetical protein